MMRGSLKYLSLAAALLLSACMVGPDYHKQVPDTALIDKTWHAPLPHGGTTADLANWWQQFDDPVMTDLILKAQTSSPSLDQALARVRQARALVTENKATLLPTLNGTASVTRGQTGAAGRTLQQTTTIAALDAGWEIDLFGGRRRGIEQTKAQLQSTQAGWHDARVTLAAEVADTYVLVRACQNDLQVLERRVKSQNDTLGLVNLKTKAGFSSTSDSDLSAATAAEALNNLESQKGICAQDVNRLVQLTGQPAAEIDAALASAKGTVPQPRATDIFSIPAKTLDQRPDVAVAERNLAAASAAIGVATAAEYPSFSLGGAIGINKVSGSSNVSTWSFGPVLSLPIFNGGALKAETERTRGVFDENLAIYRQTVRVAVNDVEDALARLDAVNRRMGAAEQSVDRYRKYLASLESSYKAGVSSLLDLEDARRTVYNAEENLIIAKQERAEAWIALYKAAGGGWSGDFAIPPTATQAEKK